MGTSEWALILVIVAVIVVITVLIVIRRRRSADGESTSVETKRPSRIGRSATALGASLRRAWGTGLDDHTWDELEEALLGADVGLEATTSVVAGVRSAAPE
ncbi:MAG: signal recognition particle receptor subunit alpha, partial [Acidimicrobiia bacterium]